LIIEIGYNNMSYVSPDGFITAIWDILPNTIIGPICVGLWINLKGDRIAKGPEGPIPGPNHADSKHRNESKVISERLGAQN
jgi:hypothetical protein